MAPESVISKGISLKDNLGKVPLIHKPIIEFFVECIDRHPELSLEQKRQWLTFTAYQYDSIKSRSIKKLRNYDYVSEVLHIPETEVIRHIKSALGDPNCESLWEKLQEEINEETKKNPDLFKNSHIKQDPISPEVSDKIKKLRKAGRPNAIIAQMTGLPENRVNQHVRKLVAKGEVPARGHTKSSPSNLTS